MIPDLLREGVQLVLLGMGVVFSLLGLTVVAVKAMSRFAAILTEPVPGENLELPVTLGAVDDSEVVAAITGVKSAVRAHSPAPAQVAVPSKQGEPLPSPLTGNVFEVMVIEGQQVQVGDVVATVEAMKMENEVRANRSGRVTSIAVREGSSVRAGHPLLFIS